MQHHEHAGHKASEHGNESHYRHLAIMTAMSFIAMYALMYAMVDRFANVFNNLNQAFMAGLMAAPMVLIELGVMRAMYQNRRLNTMFAAAAVIVGRLVFPRHPPSGGDR
jgi:hypothetical protein